MEAMKGVNGTKISIKKQKIVCIKSGSLGASCVARILNQHSLMQSFVVTIVNQSIEESKGLTILNRNVLFAARNLLKTDIREKKRAQGNAEQNYLSIVGIKYIGKEDVYNMEVRNHHNYSVCGGFIIHNCMDAIRYLVMGMWIKIKHWLPKEEQEKDKG